MLAAISGRRTATSIARNSRVSLGERCSSSSVVMDKGHAKENVYFHKEDEHLLRQMLRGHPELDKRLSAGESEVPQGGKVAAQTYKKLQKFFESQQIPINYNFASALITLLEEEGYTNAQSNASSSTSK